jgi:dihydroxy-acid dehydratase
LGLAEYLRRAQKSGGAPAGSLNGAMTDNSGDGPSGLRRGLTNYGDRAFSLYLRRSFASSMGYGPEMLDRPIVGIAHSASDFNSCHRHFPQMIEAVKRGILAAGALPLAFPTVSLGEVFLNPTSMKFRNLMSMDVEEMIRAQPMGSVVLLGGCDKTVPAQLMGAASADLPAIQLVAGPMSTGRYRGERLGACTDCRRYWAKYRSGEIDKAEIDRIEGRLASTAGTCAVMGTASTMASVAEALGMAPANSATVSAVDADRLRVAEESGRVAVELINTDLRPSRIITERAVENALRILLALGGSTNALIHLTAIAGRLGLTIDLRRVNELSDTTPVLVDLKRRAPDTWRTSTPRAAFPPSCASCVISSISIAGRSPARRSATASTVPRCGSTAPSSAHWPSPCTGPAALSPCSATLRRAARF